MGRKIVSTTLQARHHLAITKLVRGEKPVDVAREMGVDVGTIYNWQKWPLFQERAAQYAESLSREALDRGLEDAQVLIHESIAPIVMWMRDVVIGVTECKDPKRWKMALDFLHHAGIIDKQQAMKAEANPAALSFTLDQRRQQILSAGNQDLEDRLKNFRNPRQIVEQRESGR